MIFAGLDRPALLLLVLLASAAVRAIVFAGVAGLALAVFRVARTSVRLFSWRLVLYVAVAMPVLTGILPHVPWRWPAAAAIERWSSPVTPPVTPPTEPFSAASLPTPPPLARMATVTAPSWPSGQSAPSTGIPHASPRMTVPWTVAAFAIYLLGAVLLLLQGAVGWRLTRRLERAAVPIDTSWAMERLRARTASRGMTRVPRLLEADALVVPLTMWIVDPVIVLPVGWRSWSAATIDAVLAHELAHIERRDALTQRVTLVYLALFWFSPFSWWLHQHLAQLAEQASDEVALDSGADPTEYAETLLGFFAQLSGEPRRAQWHAVAMARGTDADRRIEQILAWRRGRSQRLATSLVYGVMLLAVPVAALTASAGVMVPPVPAQSRATAIPARWTPAAPAQDPIASSPAVDTPTPANAHAPALPQAQRSALEAVVQPVDRLARSVRGERMDESAVLAADETYRLAKLERDTDALGRLLNDHFAETNQNGRTRDKADTIELWRTFPITALTTDHSDVHVEGDTAIVRGRQTEHNSVGVDHMLFSRTYVRVGGTWQLLASMQFSAVEESGVLEVDEAYQQAKLQHDADALGRILSDHFVETNQNGHTMDKRSVIELWRTFPIASLTTDDADVHIEGDTAIVRGTQTERSSSGVERMLFSRTYIKTSDTWQLLESMQFRNPDADTLRR